MRQGTETKHCPAQRQRALGWGTNSPAPHQCGLGYPWVPSVPGVRDVIVPCCHCCDSIRGRDEKKPRASLLLDPLGKGLLYLPFGVEIRLQCCPSGAASYRTEIPPLAAERYQLLRKYLSKTVSF